tara:strand:- start:2576 stop:2890 length:315 start_codon:yes stop_codon:yes gene_type:complete
MSKKENIDHKKKFESLCGGIQDQIIEMLLFLQLEYMPKRYKDIFKNWDIRSQDFQRNHDWDALFDLRSEDKTLISVFDIFRKWDQEIDKITKENEQHEKDLNDE